MYVCHCNVVTDRDVIESVVNGARCVRDVALQTGAGQVCGGCISTVRELVCQACSIPSDRGQEVAGAAR
jgi:bacterioferritin-associated ferredoxin